MIVRDNYRALRTQMLAKGGTEAEARAAIEWVLGAMAPAITDGGGVPIPDLGRIAMVVVKAPKGRPLGPKGKIVYRYRRFALQTKRKFEMPAADEALS